MIHEIFPYEINNSYQQRPIDPDSIVFCFKDDAVLSRLSSSENEVQYPLFSELTTDKADARYLFDINQTGYYLVQPDQVETPAGYDYHAIAPLREMKPQHLAFASVTALHLYRWYTNNRFCGKCGETLIHSETERMLQCPVCNIHIYPKISPAVIVGVYHEDKLLLTKYANRHTDRYALVAGFTEIGETVEETVMREVMEEVGLHVKNLRYYKSQPWGVSDSLLMGFFAELDGDPEITLDMIELAEAAWVTREDIVPRDDRVSLTSEMINHFKQNGANID